MTGPGPPVSAVLYDGCPKSLKAGVWWPQTKFGLSAVVLCPKGSLGELGMQWGAENPGVVQGLLQPQQGHPLAVLCRSRLAGLEGWEQEGGGESTQPEGEHRGLGAGCRANAVTQPLSPPSPCCLSVSSRLGSGLAQRALCGEQARRLVSASGRSHGPGWRKLSWVTAEVRAGCLGLQGSASPRGQYKPCPSPAVRSGRRQVRLLTVVASLPGSLAIRAQV